MAQPQEARPQDAAGEIRLSSLIGHSHAIASTTPLEGVQKAFTQHRFKFMAVEENGRAIGLCSRDKLNEKLGSRFGFSIYAKHPARDHMLQHPEIVCEAVDIHEVLRKVFSRPTERFYEDVLVVDDQQKLVGLVTVDTLIQLQNSMLGEKIELLEESENTLREQKAKLESLADQLEAANTELSRARDEALEGTRLKSEFLANMSHEIRTPMNGIVGMISLLKETELSDDQQHFAGTVQKSADALLNIINDILDFSKIEAGKLEISPEETPLRDLIEETVQILAEAAANKDLEFILDVDAEVPDWVKLDSLRYRQVITNLVGNAIKFTEKGSVMLKISVVRDVDHGLFLRTDVRDSGIGISPENQSRLFQAFIQGDGSTNRRYGGTGLGLAISRKLVTLMEGELSCESLVGTGSTFWFDLPLTTTARTEHVPEIRGMPAGLRALIVDDHPLARDVICRQVAVLGISAQTAPEGPDALRTIREAYRNGEPFDYVFLDLDMPEMDGLEVCDQIAQDPDLDHLRVILMTTVGQSSNKRKINARAINKAIYKPICPSDIVRTLHALKPDTPAGQRVHPPVSNENKNRAPRIEPMRILLAEDSETNQEVAIRILEKLGCEVYLATDGYQALDLMRAGQFDCILMDCQMPKMDGYEATRAIREGFHGVLQQDIHIIAMTAHAMQGDKQKCLQAGMNDYLSKPVTLQRVTEVLAHYQQTRNGTVEA